MRNWNRLDNTQFLEYVQTLSVPAFEELTPEQQAGLVEGPGLVQEHVTLYQPTSPEQFTADPDVSWALLQGEEVRTDQGDAMESVINLASLFSRPPSGSIAAMRSEGMPALRRLRIIFPEAIETLEIRIAGRDLFGLDRSTVDALFYTYELLAQLVDRNDPHVVSASGQVDESYLLR